MGLLSRTPNGELETEAMIAVVQSGPSEKNGAGGGSGDGDVEVRECVDVTAKHTRPTWLGEEQQVASAREEFTGTKRASLDATTMRQRRLPGWA